jgi:hypothetical protein
MTSRRERSPRARARENYLAAPEAKILHAPEPPVNELEPFVRDLYENSVLPVHEIARIVGVTERTIYKRAKKGGWKPRVVRLGRGAGGRYATRADEGAAVRGLMALDPDGAARAAGRCVAAGLLSKIAAAAAVQAAQDRADRARAEKESDQRARSFGLLLDTLREVVRLRARASPRLALLAGRIGKVAIARIAGPRAPPASSPEMPPTPDLHRPRSRT